MTTTDLVNSYIEEADKLLNEQKVDIDEQSVSLLMLHDTSKLALENLAKAYVDIDFEIYKLQLCDEKLERMEIKRLFAFQRVIRHLMQDIISYRGRMEDKHPDMLEQKVDTI